MKRKKPPIALISFLVISLLGLVIFSKTFGFYNLSSEDQQKEMQKQAEDRARAAQASAPAPVGKIDASKELAAMKNNLKSTVGDNKKPMERETSVESRKASVPTVIMPSDEVRKPTLNPSSPSSQWYDGK